ncbi:MAG: T9SS type A sorting domain-containing protein [Chitinophagales bacterium]
MKKISLLFFIGILCNCLFAQPILTSSIVGTFGDHVSFTGINADGFDPGEDGNAAFWDFSAATPGGTDYGYTWIDASTTPYAADFPGANFSSDEGSGVYAYYKLTAAEFSFYGLVTPFVTQVYTDPEKLYTFPIHFGDEFSDDLYCAFNSGVDFIRSGSSTTTADGFGTLKLSSGTYDKVFRVVLKETYSDEAVGVPVTNDYDFTTYYWFREGTPGPLFIYAYQQTTTAGVTTTTELAWLNNSIILLGAEDVLNTTEMQVYPNPAADVLHIHTSSSADPNTQFVIRDIMGRMIIPEQNMLAGDMDIAIDMLPAGMYVLECISGAETLSKQFQKL